MLRNAARRLSRAANKSDDEDDIQRRDKQPSVVNQDDQLEEETDRHRDGESSSSSSSSTSTPRPTSRRQSSSRPRAKSRGRRRSLSVSRPPEASAGATKRVQWAPKNRIEHFEHVPLEDEEENDDEGEDEDEDDDEDTRNLDESMRELDEFGANPVVLARLHRALEPFVPPSGREHSRTTREAESRLPEYLSQPKPAPRTKNIKRLFNHPRPSVTSKQTPSHSNAAEQPRSVLSHRISSASRNVRDRGESQSTYDPERKATLDSALDPEYQPSTAQELHDQLVEQYSDPDRSQRSVPDAKPGMPLPISSRTHQTEDIQGTEKTQTQAQTQTHDGDTIVEERGQQEDRARAPGRPRPPPTRTKGQVPRRRSIAVPLSEEPPQQGETGETGTGAGAGAGRLRRASRAAADPDLEAGLPGQLNEPLPLGNCGVLGSILYYKNPDFRKTISGLNRENAGDESTAPDTQGVSEDGRDRARPRRDTEQAEVNERRERATSRAGRRSSVWGRRPTLSLPHRRVPSPEKKEEEESLRDKGKGVAPGEKPEPPPPEKEEEMEPSSPEFKGKGKGVVRDERPEPSDKRSVRDRRATGLPPFYIPSSPEESSSPSPSPSPERPQPPVAPLAVPVPRKQSAQARRRTGLLHPQFPSEPSPERERERSPSPSLSEEEEEGEGAPPRKPPKLYSRIIKKSLSAPASVLHLPLPAYIPQPPIPAVASSALSRSSGGVIAALIATSNALMGPAAPFSNTIAPDLTKRGYTLSRYHFLSGQQSPTVRTASEDPKLRVCQEQADMQAQAGERPVTDEDIGGGVRYRPRRGTSETGTTDTTLAESPASTPAKDERFFGEYPERPSKRSSHAWLPGVLSRSASSIFGEKDRGGSTEYTSSQVSLSGTDQERHRKRARRKRKKMERIYITRHIAEVRQRQEFMMRFIKAHLMFSGPSHRLPVQLQSTARVLDLQVSSVHLPNVVLISFGDELASTSMVKIIQQTGTLDLGKLSLMQNLFWEVTHDKISVAEASERLIGLMEDSKHYSKWLMILTGGLSSSAICIISFSGSFADALVVFPLGSLLVAVQIFSAKHELYSNVFEISVATLLSFLSAALASSSKFCYAALASSSVVLILPGFFVLSGSLELASKQIVSGAVRICFAVIYALFLGFGISIGAEIFTRITHRQVVGPDDILCNTAHMPTDPWWQRKPSRWWSFLTVPLYSLVLSLRNHATFLNLETLIAVVISSAGWTANHFAGIAFHKRPDLQSAIGAFAVGVLANLYGRIYLGKAYVVMITGILFQLPSGLANGGLLTFAKVDNSSNNGGGFTSFESGFQVALQLIAVAIGLTVGLFTSVVVVHPFGGSKKRSNAVFSL